MFIRQPLTDEVLLDGVLRRLAKRPNIYLTAFPFDRCENGGPGSVAFLSLHGYATTITALSDLWPQNIVKTWPSAGFTIGLSSSSATDTAAGAGARTVEIDLLDTDYVPHTITLSLNGQTKVTSTEYVGTTLRINGLRITSWGANNVNAGALYVYDASDTVTAGVPQTDAKIFYRMVASANVTRCGFYTVPLGCKLQIIEARGGFNDTITTVRAATINVRIYKSGVAMYLPLVGQVTLYAPNFTIRPKAALIFDEKTDLVLQCIPSASLTISAFVDAILYYEKEA